MTETARTSNVHAAPFAEPADAAAWFARKLSVETDPSDVWADLKAGATDFVFADVRSAKDYGRSHAQGAISLPQRDITPERMSAFPPDTRFVVYCWGSGCNGGAKAGAKLAALGFRVKEMIGGILTWEETERLPVERSC